MGVLLGVSHYTPKIDTPKMTLKAYSMGKLTDIRIRKIKPAEKQTKHADGGGLYLLVTSTGCRYWRYKYRFEGKENILALGIYPTVTLADARLKHLEARKLLASGIDPSADRKEKKKAEQMQMSFSEVVKIYLEKEAVKHKGLRWETNALNKLLRLFPNLAKKPINAIDKMDMINFRNSREFEVQGTTVKREMQLLGSVFSFAIDELSLIEISPLNRVAKPKENPHREVRISDDEIQILMDAFDFNDETPVLMMKHQTAWAFLFALETAMRMSEITSMTWGNLFDDYLLLPTTKNGHSRKVPLNHTALELLERVKGLDTTNVLTISADSLSTTFRKYRDTTPLGHIHFHDTRHEATTKYAQVMPIQDLSKVTGHKDLEMLMRYYNPTTTELAERMNRKTNKKQ
ncbi:site-specific integrase [Acinetobacter sp. A3.8]|uniref:Site-specific integrase n=1 Tax=Acinetobacter sedimenti TaxID=2919922 RepID=A0A9X2B6Q4_9GAMM|nr:site-specific integrase [Acinetobacter sedimenti]MCJ8147141.1 site-specific integrase [Acinetobacter sedimenti]